MKWLEKSIVFHKYVTWLGTFVGKIHRYLSWQKNVNAMCIYGLIFSSLSFLIILSSFNCIRDRKRNFNFFLVSHWLIFWGIIITCLLHKAYYAAYAFIFTLIDLLVFRVYYNFAQKVKIQDISILPSNVIRIEFDKKNFTYNAGQYVFICMPAISDMLWSNIMFFFV